LKVHPPLPSEILVSSICIAIISPGDREAVACADDVEIVGILETTTVLWYGGFAPIYTLVRLLIVFKRSSRLMGLVTYPSMPDRRHWSCVSAMALAVSAMIGTRR